MRRSWKGRPCRAGTQKDAAHLVASQTGHCGLFSETGESGTNSPCNQLSLPGAEPSQLGDANGRKGDPRRRRSKSLLELEPSGLSLVPLLESSCRASQQRRNGVGRGPGQHHKAGQRWLGAVKTQQLSYTTHWSVHPHPSSQPFCTHRFLSKNTCDCGFPLFPHKLGNAS